MRKILLSGCLMFATQAADMSEEFTTNVQLFAQAQTDIEAAGEFLYRYSVGNISKAFLEKYPVVELLFRVETFLNDYAASTLLYGRDLKDGFWEKESQEETPMSKAILGIRAYKKGQYDTARVFLEEAVEHDVVAALNCLAKMNLKGYGLKGPNLHLSKRLYKLAAKSGSGLAYYQLACNFDLSYEKKLKYLREAASFDYSPALKTLALNRSAFPLSEKEKAGYRADAMEQGEVF